MATETINIQIREDGSRVVKRNLEDVGKTAEASAKGVDILKTALGGIAAFLAIDKIRQYADAWSSASGMIDIATKSHEESLAVQEKIYQAAQRTRTGMTDMVELYSRAQRAGSDLGASQNEIIKFTEGVGMALAIQHTSTTKASGALLQLGQALSGSKIQAQEFNSLVDGAPVILQTVAKHLDGASGSVGQLTRMVKDGKVSSKEFFDAFMAGSGDLEKDFGKASMTIGQGFQIMENAAIKYLGQMDKSLGISQAFGTVAKWVAQNMDLIATALGMIGAAAAVAFAPALISTFAGAVAGLWALILANPYLALGAVIAACVVALVSFRDEMKLGIDDTTTMGDLYRAVGETISSVFEDLATVAKFVFGEVTGANEEAYGIMNDKTKEATESWTSSYSGFYSGVGSGFAGMLRGIARTIDAIAGLLTELGLIVVRAIGGLPDVIGEMFNRSYNLVTGVIESMINTVIGGINKLRSLVGTELLETVKFEKMEVDADAFTRYGQGIGNAISDGFDMQGGFLEKQLVSVFDRAAEIGKTRLAAVKPAAPNLDTALGAGRKTTGDDNTKKIEKLRNELRSLLNTIDPIPGAYLEMEKARSILIKSEEKGLITGQQHKAYLVALDRHYKDILDPLGAMNRELDQQIASLGLNSQARAVHNELLTREKALLKDNIVMSVEERAALEAKLTTLQKTNELVAAQDSLLANSVQQRQAFATQLQAIQNLLADPTSGFGKGDATTALAGANPGLFEGTQEALDAQVLSYQNMYAQIDQMRQANLISEQTAEQMRAKVSVQQNEALLANSRAFFGNLAVLAQSGNSKVAAIGKAAAITQATIDGYLAIQKALASAPPPVNYALAGAVGVATAANVAKIAGIGFATGGSFTVGGGSGGTDSKMVSFRATPGERVTVGTPTQVRKGTEQNSAQAPAKAPDVKIVNVVDPNLMHDYMNTSEGEQLFVNLLQRNQRSLQTIMNG